MQFAMLAGVASVPLMFGLLITLTQSYFVAYGAIALAVFTTAAYAALTLTTRPSV